MMTGLMIGLALTGVMGWFAALRLRTYLHMFQQEEYDNLRFLAWWFKAMAFDRWLSLGLLALAPVAYAVPAAAPWGLMLWLLWRGHKEPDPTCAGKKPLVLTERALRLWVLAGVLASVMAGLLAAPLWGAALQQGHALMLVLLVALVVQGLPLLLILANGLLWPLQWALNRHYLKAAHGVLLRLNPTVVSISGAFGKTTTKYLLRDILSAHAPTLMPPGSTNTALGMARVVLNQLQPHHQYFMAEMGAYRIGSIARLCKIFPPHACATTAIGAAHYERFKTLEAVAQAEMEVLEATLARGGPAVLSVDCIPPHLWQHRVAEAPQIKLVGSDPALLRGCDYLIREAHYHAHGQTLKISHGGETSTLSSPLYGRTMTPNIGTAFALATELGIPKRTSIAALAHAGGAPHRLQRREEGALTILDDSYNSNPEGFRTALETLTLIARAHGKGPMRRRILITPGMVELGALHDAEHAALGAYAAQHADVVLVVAPGRIPTFIEALRKANHGAVHPLPNLKAAWAWLAANGQPADVVLLENDLPDLYESRWSL